MARRAWSRRPPGVASADAGDREPQPCGEHDAGDEEARAHAEQGRDGAHEHGDGRIRRPQAMYTISRDATTRAGTRWGYPGVPGISWEGGGRRRAAHRARWPGVRLVRPRTLAARPDARSRRAALAGRSHDAGERAACLPVVQPPARRPPRRRLRPRPAARGRRVDVDAVRRSLTRLAGSPRRAHREAAARQLQRLATVWRRSPGDRVEARPQPLAAGRVQLPTQAMRPAGARGSRPRRRGWRPPGRGAPRRGGPP